MGRSNDKIEIVAKNVEYDENGTVRVDNSIYVKKFPNYLFVR